MFVWFVVSVLVGGCLVFFVFFGCVLSVFAGVCLVGFNAFLVGC